SIPSLAINHLTWQAPASLVNLQSPRTEGATQSVLDNAKTTRTLHVHLGQESQAQIRWRTAAVTPAASGHEVREHYYWNLDPAAPSLSAVLAYTPAGRLEIWQNSVGAAWLHAVLATILPAVAPDGPEPAAVSPQSV
ncbi:MAG: hypothetical protein H7Z15_11965, partial [Rhizobacter sp.]|nr:hypothetical protein [Rhizobacter sp.]